VIGVEKTINNYKWLGSHLFTSYNEMSIYGTLSKCKILCFKGLDILKCLTT